jgi:hypothetical protein
MTWYIGSPSETKASVKNRTSYGALIVISFQSLHRKDVCLISILTYFTIHIFLNSSLEIKSG